MVPRPRPAPPPAAVGGFDTTSDEIDDEIREVFSRNSEEEMGNLDQARRRRRARGPGETAPIRACSTRSRAAAAIVGAKALGEFSWKDRGHAQPRSTPRAPPARRWWRWSTRRFTLPQLHAALRGEGGDQRRPRRHGSRGRSHRHRRGRVLRRARDRRGTGAGGTGGRGNRHRRAGARARRGTGRRGRTRGRGPVLLEILDAEVLGHLATVENWLQGAGDGAPASDAAARRTHHERRVSR